MRKPAADGENTLDRPLFAKAPPNLKSRPITKADFDMIVQVVDHWWGGPIAVLVHPIFFYEFGRWARVVEDTAREGRFVGFMLGFVTQPEGDGVAVGYLHLVGIDPEYRRRGVARALYEDFRATCVREGCRRMKAITTVGNEASVRFHQALGFTAHEEPDYAGPSRKRLVMTLDL
jgi:ribosomal protein S18 acetylase RimI-like enzyme